MKINRVELRLLEARKEKRRNQFGEQRVFADVVIAQKCQQWFAWEFLRAMIYIRKMFRKISFLRVQKSTWHLLCVLCLTICITLKQMKYSFACCKHFLSHGLSLSALLVLYLKPKKNEKAKLYCSSTTWSPIEMHWCGASGETRLEASCFFV